MTDDAWIDTVRLARDFGTVSELFPSWVESVRDLPHALFELIRTAMVFLGFEELAPDEQPPKRIWLQGEKLKEWFAEVNRRRHREAGGSGSGNGSQPIEDPVQNEAAKGLIVG